MKRALGALLAGGLLAVLGPAPVAHADESITTGAWQGSTLVPEPRPCDGNDICGQFQREASILGRRSVAVSFTLEAIATTPGCELPPTPASVPATPSPAVFSRPLTFECNGTYRSVASASANLSGGTQSLDRTFLVADPAPDVDAPVATAAADRSVVVSWSPLAAPPKDLRGYVVLRTGADGLTEQLATVPLGETTWTDTTTPADGGSFTYQVRTRRAGANPADPGDEVTSSGASTAPVDLAPAGGGTDGATDGGSGGGTGGTGGGTDGGTGGATDGGTDGGTGGGDGSGTGGSSGGAGGGRADGSSPSLSSPSFRVPRVGTPSRNFFPPLLAPPVDDGFDELLPYEDREPGAEEAVLPDDLASAPLEQAAGRGLVVPFATGLVLAVWALHLRFLARMGQPKYAELDDDGVEIVGY